MEVKSKHATVIVNRARHTSDSLMILLALAVVLVLCSQVSALGDTLRKMPPSPVADIDAMKYPVLQIKDFFGVGSTIADLSLIKHTESCGTRCSSEFTVSLANDMPLVDNLKFLDEYGNEVNIQDYSFQVLTDVKEVSVDDYSDVCIQGVTALNGSVPLICHKELSGSHTEEIPLYEPYKMGAVMPSGDYTVLLTGKKKPYQYVDWQIMFDGKWLTDWASWGTSTLNKSLVSVHTFNNNNLLDLLNNSFDLTTNSGNINTSSIGRYLYGINASNATAIGNNVPWKISPFSLLNNQNNITLSFWFNQSGSCNGGYNQTTLLGTGISADYNQNFYLTYSCGLPKVIGWSIGSGAGWGGFGTSTDAFSQNTWHLVLLEMNKTQIRLYVDDVLENTSNTNSASFNWSAQMYLFDGGNVDNNLRPASNLRIDEIYVWNRTLSQNEKDTLYDSGFGTFFNVSTIISVSSNYPLSGSSVLNNGTIPFNCSATTITGGQVLANVTNISLFGNFNGVYGLNDSQSYIGNTTANAIFNVDLNYGSYLFSCRACATDGTCASTTNSSISVIGFSENNQSFNSSTYETATESYTLNFTYVSSDFSIVPTFYYNVTPYTATTSCNGNNCLSTAQVSFASGSAKLNNPFHWSIAMTNSTGTTYVNSTFNYQNVTAVNFSICGSAPQNIPYMNFTFIDESTLTAINASTDLATWTTYFTSLTNANTYLYVATNKPSYAYCFSPPDKTIQSTLLYQYSATGYPLRTFIYSGSLTNTTTNKVLYLLSSTAGAYSTFAIQTSAGTPISGATVQVERQFSGVWTVVGYGTSDSAGGTTFWLNPNYQHRITVTKSGYTTNQVTIQPTQSVYTIFLTTNLGNATYAMPIKGIYYTHTPISGLLYPGAYVYTFNISAMNNNMVNCRFDLVNGTNRSQILSTTSSPCTSNGYLTQTYTANPGDSIFGYYYVDTGSGWILLEGDGNWKFIATNASSTGTLKRLINYLSDDTVWTNGDMQDYMKYEYTKFVALFLILAVLLAAANIGFAIDTMNPGIVLFGLPLIFTILSIAGGVNGHGYLYLQNLTVFPFLDNYLLTAYSWGIAIGLYFATVRREG